MAGIDQQITQYLVVLADAGADFRECRVAIACSDVRTLLSGRQRRKLC
jgi:hypothetical protein